MKATREAFGYQLPLMGDKYDNIVALDADLGKATKIASFKESHPDRFFQMGIAESNMIGVASGISEYGYKVFLASFGSFLTGRYDQIRCKDGVTQMALEDVSIMRALPNMNILNPASYSEAIKVIKYLCETELDSPYYLRLGRQPVEDIEMPFEFGKGQVVKQTHAMYDITLFSTGCILGDVVEASNLIQNNSSHNVRVVNLPTVKPIDREIIIESAKQSKYLFTIEDHSIVGGLGSAVSEVLTDECPKKLVRIGLNDVFPESAPPKDLYEKYGLSAGQLAKRILSESMDK